jgi:hypothetical protein
LQIEKIVIAGKGNAYLQQQNTKSGNETKSPWAENQDGQNQLDEKTIPVAKASAAAGSCAAYHASGVGNGWVKKW